LLCIAFSNNYQINIFETLNIKHKPLMQAIDKLNRTFKLDRVKLANQNWGILVKFINKDYG